MELVGRVGKHRWTSIGNFALQPSHLRHRDEVLGACNLLKLLRHWWRRVSRRRQVQDENVRTGVKQRMIGWMPTARLCLSLHNTGFCSLREPKGFCFGGTYRTFHPQSVSHTGTLLRFRTEELLPWLIIYKQLFRRRPSLTAFSINFSRRLFVTTVFSVLVQCLTSISKPFVYNVRQCFSAFQIVSKMADHSVKEISERFVQDEGQDGDQCTTSPGERYSTNPMAPLTVWREVEKGATRAEQGQCAHRNKEGTTCFATAGKGGVSSSWSKHSEEILMDTVVDANQPLETVVEAPNRVESTRAQGDSIHCTDAQSKCSVIREALLSGEPVTRAELEEIQKEIAMQERVVRALDEDNEKLHTEKKALLLKVRELTSALSGRGAHTPVSDGQPNSKQTLRSGDLTTRMETRQGTHHSTDELLMETNQQRMRVRELELELELLRRERGDLNIHRSSVDMKRLEELELENRNLRVDLKRRETEHEEVVKEMARKIAWYVNNQEFNDSQQQLLKEQQDTIRCLRAKLRGSGKAEDISKGTKAKEDTRVQHLTRRIIELEETLGQKHPNSIAQLIRSCQPPVQDTKIFKQLNHRIKELEDALVEKDRCAEAAVTRLRVEVDRMRMQYQEKIEKLEEQLKFKLLQAQSRRVHDLEKQLTEAKQSLRDKEQVNPPSSVVGANNLTSGRYPRGNGNEQCVTQGATKDTVLSEAPAASGPPKETSIALLRENGAPEPQLSQLEREPKAGIALTSPSYDAFIIPPPMQVISTMQAQIASLTSQLEVAKRLLEESQQSLGEAHARLDERLRSARREYQAQLQCIQQSYRDDIEHIKDSHKKELMSITELKQVCEGNSWICKDISRLPLNRSRIQAFLQSVSERLSYLEKRQAQKEKEALHRIEEIRRVADFEIVLTKQKAEMIVEEKNQQIQGFRLQLDHLLETLALL
ncbi:hypothetical protein, conserved [Trypanosoma brucei brucei TREU927]|uniref:Centrosomal protein of 162 kDa n=1 Tax=Trypanosoma brucei brucei (strain 927/4 GUTat10.1) TaxID=185431 RepID=Q57W85_TRYB2|nr:hypothetical protein, conserved [Trypanosoma brucei brucei TREU927]AAX70134.1 hypothetical protein, conserved [Trypanosoma brucei]AAZ13053.1 hypothetical protein, conserved [Trypanosoma brucei brucei TREU927]